MYRIHNKIQFKRLFVAIHSFTFFERNLKMLFANLCPRFRRMVMSFFLYISVTRSLFNHIKGFSWHSILFIETDWRIYALAGQYTKPSLVQIMVCNLYKSQSLSEPMVLFANWNTRDKCQWNLNHKGKAFIQEHASILKTSVQNGSPVFNMTPLKHIHICVCHHCLFVV